MFLSERVLNIEPSATLEVSNKVMKLKECGEKVISLGTGEPDFDTPLYIREAAIDAINKGFTHYTPSSGIKALKDAVIEKFKRENGIIYEPSNIIISNGAKHSLYNLFETVINPGDEVIIPVPYWVSYVEMIKIAGGVPVFVETDFEEGFLLKAEKISKKITEKTKAILLNSPNNPTGKVIQREDLLKIGNLAVEKNILIISDEIYEKLTYDGEYVSIASLSEEIKNITVVINGVSKSHAMTGWRIGYTAAPKEIAKYMDAFQGHTTSNANSIAQKASIEALMNDDKILYDMKDEFKKRRDYLYDELSKMDKFRMPPKPEGAFYLFVNIEKFGMKSVEFCNYVLEKEKIGIVPGIAFGMDDFVRLSYATSMTELIEAVDRLKRI